MYTICCLAALAGLDCDLPAPACCPTPYLRCEKSCGGCAGEEPYVPQEGDLFFGWSGNVVRKMLFVVTRAGPPSHIGMVVRRPDGTLAIFEATAREPQYGDRPGVFLRDLMPRLSSYEGTVWIRRIRTPLTCEQCACLTAFAMEQEGKKFAMWRSILVPPLTLPRRGPLCNALCGPARTDRDRWFCTEMLVAAGIKLGLLDPTTVKPTSTDPQDMFVDTIMDLSCIWEKPRELTWKGGCGE